MSVKKIAIMVLVCVFTIFTISPAVSMAAEAAAASAGVAGSGATAGLGTAGMIAGVGLGIIAIVLIADAINDDDDYYPPSHGAHHGH